MNGTVGDGKVVSVINAIEESDVLLQSEDSDEHWMKVKALQNELMQKGCFMLSKTELRREHQILQIENHSYFL